MRSGPVGLRLGEVKEGSQPVNKAAAAPLPQTGRGPRGASAGQGRRGGQGTGLLNDFSHTSQTSCKTMSKGKI